MYTYIYIPPRGEEGTRERERVKKKKTKNKGIFLTWCWAGRVWSLGSALPKVPGLWLFNEHFSLILLLLPTIYQDALWFEVPKMLEEKKCQKEEGNRTPWENKGSQLRCFQLRIAHCQSCAQAPVCFCSLVACSEAKAAAFWTVLSFNDKSNMMKVWNEAINSALEGKVKATGRTPGVGKVRALGGTVSIQYVPEPPPPQQPDDVDSRAGNIPFTSQLNVATHLRPGAPHPAPTHAWALTWLRSRSDCGRQSCLIVLIIFLSIIYCKASILQKEIKGKNCG